MNLESDKRLIQLRLDFSSAPTGEARQAGREDIESLSVVSEPERPTNTPCLERVSATSRTAVYGSVRTVVWEGRSREAPPYPDHWPLSTFVATQYFVSNRSNRRRAADIEPTLMTRCRHGTAAFYGDAQHVSH